jgi:hypothetical protein
MITSSPSTNTGISKMPISCTFVVQFVYRYTVPKSALSGTNGSGGTGGMLVCGENASPQIVAIGRGTKKYVSSRWKSSTATSGQTQNHKESDEDAKLGVLSSRRQTYHHWESTSRHMWGSNRHLHIRSNDDCPCFPSGLSQPYCSTCSPCRPCFPCHLC